VTKHDVIAFLTHLAEIVGPEARFVHQGMTSSDVLDTCLNVQLARAADLLLADLDAVLAALKRRAFEHKDTPTIGRSHGIHAEPTTFGLKLAGPMPSSPAQAPGWSPRAPRSPPAPSRARSAPSPISIRGSRNMSPSQLGLSVEPVSTQVIPRDRHAMFFATLGVIASSIERLATEIRHLQRTEVLEAEEYFSPGQKGSSAMPHKRNPVLTENLTGLARMVRAPWCRRWRTWRCGTSATSRTPRSSAHRPRRHHHARLRAGRLAGVIEKLVVYPERMQKNLDKLGGLVHSQRVLLALTQAGAPAARTAIAGASATR
jgi:adenylosuccinate lyase